MLRRRRRRPTGQNTANPQAAKPPVQKPAGPKAPTPPKGTTPPPKPAPPKKNRRQILDERLRKLLADYPLPLDKIPEALNLCHEALSLIRRGDKLEISAEELEFILCNGVETVCEDEIDRLYLAEYRDKLKVIRTQSGLGEHDYWELDDPKVPDEYLDLLNEFREKKRKILGRKLRKLGEEGLARKVEDDYPTYQALKQAGKTILFSRTRFHSVMIQPETDHE